MIKSFKFIHFPLRDRALSDMEFSATVYPLRLIARLPLVIWAVGMVLIPMNGSAQELMPEGLNDGSSTTDESLELNPPSPSQGVQPVDPNQMRPLALGESFLSIQGGKRLLEEASQAVTRENYTEAASKLQEARQVFNQLSNFYQQLATSFSGIDNRVADLHRNNARQTAQMRDDATYQLALVHRAQNQPELAVPLLIQIIRSQAPTRDLGKKAYQQLFELGFVDSPIPDGQSSEQSTSSAQ
ncbi:hypothetical protein VB836_10680 [Limnoraphis robusta BA-68 BA1]|jgi:hypothetical protein|nr:hypothetical protein [Limnoraphis robusta]MEA5497672.1 hypothetical protein [Limnoraphis robusta BA-68 BA1]